MAQESAGGRRTLRLSQLVERFGGVVEGDATLEVSGVTGVDNAGPGDTTFALDEARLAAAEKRGVACVIVPRGLRASPVTLLRSAAPERLVADWLRFFYPEPRPSAGIHPSAIIGAGTRIDPTASVGPYVVLGADCRIAAGAVLMSSVVVAEQCEIGADAVIHPHVTIYARSVIGARVIVHAGAVVGADGFGYFFEGGQLHKWPHVGNVVLEDDVEIGANACVDRARFGSTRIERGAKIDNLVQIGHNCRVGAGAMLSGQTGLSGSVVIEPGVICAGQVGIADHRTIGRGARLGAQSGIMRDVPAGTDWIGYPARPAKQHFSEVALLAYLGQKRSVLRRLIREAEAQETSKPY